jgi:hypothetical protein
VAALVVLYRAAFFYGTSRWIAWSLWAHVVHHYPYDLSWGGPHWVSAAHSKSLSWLQVLGVAGILATGVAFAYAYRRGFVRRGWEAVRLRA